MACLPTCQPTAPFPATARLGTVTTQCLTCFLSGPHAYTLYCHALQLPDLLFEWITVLPSVYSLHCTALYWAIAFGPPPRGMCLLTPPGCCAGVAGAGAVHVKKDYWITDGLYGSFNCILYDGQSPEYMVCVGLGGTRQGGGGAKSRVSGMWMYNSDAQNAGHRSVMHQVSIAASRLDGQ